ncbi:hypothetical protein PPTG_24140 [Phytophthora nicotianae INRA-310]|uniref:Uncharacterized protein n=4 Tax=Phytophthora nicotianae TaxID=4792 RepID=W2PJA5_PHYN3|nr:hypothetical protein PPTG_24140 [Phytophthora nicotianae INRA-310]ETI33675.1 hypothetical protein F443_19666 [Phytophthora nicotianae P1569]ETM33910.1 hypothetical protein L914_18901 [Phytophthora nicotianae]ETN01103.1 hypothetical protein PPTG_24140 [Phytophthora nicotianae INRA-310]ETO62467.1 hypothetical protein F444_19624 [Phytophthora nicotianae P1976]
MEDTFGAFAMAKMGCGTRAVWSLVVESSRE